ncbi:MAG: general secretion pathway protein GspK [Candidatus Omnitrophica bacterium]|nr:general secretion pathway protein GspK [Candidatus Omnitrophota bacterium]MBU1923864.1 general secretion pathway protein GspK [Candidatus Omnitrophota bacterium]
MLKERDLERSSTLIITLWVLGFLTILVVNLGFMVRSQLQFADHLQDRLKMYCLARAGIERAIVELYADEDRGNDALNEPWANKEEFFKDLPLGDGFITVSYKLGSQEGQEEITLYGAMDESSKIDINNAPVEILITLLERIGLVGKEDAIDIARAIMDWRDQDVVVWPGGAENEYYQGLSSPYECKNGKFQIAEELLLVKGMTPEVFSEIKGIITVYGTERVNINTASWDCLYALGLNSSLCERIIKFRQGSDELAGTEDDFVFNYPTELLNIGPLFTEESIQINSLISRNMLTAKSNIFRVSSLGQLKNERGVRSREIICVLKRQADKGAKILYWHEN